MHASSFLALLAAALCAGSHCSARHVPARELLGVPGGRQGCTATTELRLNWTLPFEYEGSDLLVECGTRLMLQWDSEVGRRVGPALSQAAAACCTATPF